MTNTEGFTTQTVATLRTLDDDALRAAIEATDPHVHMGDVRESLAAYPDAARIRLSSVDWDYLPDYILA